MNWLIFLVIACGLSLTGWILWRISGLPCPSWLGWVLENPLIKCLGDRSVLQHLELKPGLQVLDLGCGPGRLTIPVARQIGPSGEAAAVDLQPKMLEFAQKRAQAAGLTNIRFLQAAAGSGKLGQACFDRALLVTVLGEIPGRPAALNELFAALKPGGFLTISEMALDPHFLSRATVRRLAAAAGFREKACFGTWFSYTINFEKPAS